MPLSLAASVLLAAAGNAVAVPPQATQANPRPPLHVPKKPKPAMPGRDPRALRYIAVDGVGEVAIYQPTGAPRGIALFASGDGGWNLGVLEMAHVAARLGYWVAGFSTPVLLKQLGAVDSKCSDVAGAFAALGGRIAREFGLPSEWKPVLIGYSSGATLVYAALAQDGGDKLGGGVSLGFCPDLIVRKPFCRCAGLTASPAPKPQAGIVFDNVSTVRAPWRVLQGEIDQVCDPKFATEYTATQADARAWLLPKVGHGFGMERRWMPQYREAIESLSAP